MFNQFKSTLFKSINLNPESYPELLPFLQDIRLVGDRVGINFLMKIRDKNANINEFDSEREIVVNHSNYIEGAYNQNTDTWEAYFDMKDNKDLVIALQNYVDNFTGEINPKFSDLDFNQKRSFVEGLENYIKEVKQRIVEKETDIEKTNREIKEMKSDNETFDDLRLEAKKKGLI